MTEGPGPGGPVAAGDRSGGDGPTARTPTRGELVALVLAVLVAATAVISLVAAWLGVHDGRVALALGALVAAGVAATQRRRWAAGRWAAHDGAALAVALVALAVFVPGARYGAKLADPGVYVLHGTAIARTGELAAPDPLFEAAADEPGLEVDVVEGEPVLVTDEGALSARGQPYRGLSTSSDSVDEFVPSFLHLWPALLATAHDLGGRGALFDTGPVLGALTLGLLFVGLRRVVGPVAGTAAVGFLALNVLQVWQVRFPTSEALAQFLLVGGGATLALALRLRWRMAAAVAGGLVGAAYLARADGLFVVLLALALVAGTWALGRWNDLAAAFATGLVPVFALGLVQAYGPASGYTANQRGAPSLTMVLAVVALLAAVAWAAGAWLRGSGRWATLVTDALDRPEVQRRLVVGLALALAAYLALSWFRIDLLGEHVRVNRAGERTRDFDELSLRRLGWIVTYPALLLAGVGLAVAVRRPRPVLLVLVPALALLPVYLWDPRIAPYLFWWGRRFVPLTLPLVAVLLGVAAHWGLADAERRRTVVGVAVGLALAASALLEARALRPVLGHRELDGSVAVVEVVERVAGPDGVLLWEGGLTATRLFAAVPAMSDGRVSLVGPPSPTEEELAAIAGAFGDRPVYLVAEPGTFDELDVTSSEVTGVIARIDRFDRAFRQLPAGSAAVVADVEMARIEP